MSNHDCDCASRTPTYPVFRATPHLPGCPFYISDDAVAIVAAINELRGGEGASVTINCQNPDFNGHDNEAVEVVDEWTNWQTRRFEGRTLRVALENAVHEKTRG